MYTHCTVGGTVGFSFFVNTSITDQFRLDLEKDGDEPNEYEFRLAKFTKSQFTSAESSLARMDTHWGIVVTTPKGVSYLHHITGAKNCNPCAATDGVTYCIDEFKHNSSAHLTVLGSARIYMSNFICKWAKNASNMTGISFILGETCQVWCKNSLKQYGVDITTGTDAAVAIGTFAAITVALGYLIFGFNPEKDESRR